MFKTIFSNRNLVIGIAIIFLLSLVKVAFFGISISLDGDLDVGNRSIFNQRGQDVGLFSIDINK